MVITMDRINYIRQLNAFWEVQGEDGYYIKSTSVVVYLSLLQINNSCGWKDPFLATYTQVLSMTGIANHKTYYSALDELVRKNYLIWNKSKNQHQAASFSIKVLYQNSEEQVSSTPHASSMHTEEQLPSTVHIPKPSKQLNKKTKEVEFFSFEGFSEQAVKEDKVLEFEFDAFWNKYPIKVGKKNAQKLWLSLKRVDQQKIMDTISAYAKYKPFESYRHLNPTTYLNQERWNDELVSAQASSIPLETSGFIFGAKPKGAVNYKQKA
jgi:hypothetical protein